MAGGESGSMTSVIDPDLLSDGIPPEWFTTRHCPSCHSTTLRVSSGEWWCTTSCGQCGRELRRDHIDGPVWEDQDWAKGGEQ